jgi:hypothetical protein
MDANEYDCIQCEILLLILVPQSHCFILEFCHIFHKWFQKHINIGASLLRTLDKNRQHKLLSFVTQPCRKVVHHEDDWPCVVHGPCHTPFQERGNEASICVPRMFKLHAWQQLINRCNVINK